jgi:hypothetical protein
MPLEIIVPVVMSCALLWWIGRDMTWSRRLTVMAVTLVIILFIILIERAGFSTDQLRR